MLLEKHYLLNYTNSVENNIAKHPKQFWSFIKSRSSFHGIDSSLRCGSVSVNSGSDVCNVDDYNTISDITRIIINSDTLTNLLRKLDPSKSKQAGMGHLQALFLNCCAVSITKPLQSLFQRSFAECCAPAL